MGAASGTPPVPAGSRRLRITRLPHAFVLAAAPVLAALPVAFWVWLHRDTERFVEILGRSGFCGEIGSGPVQIRVVGALLLLALLAVISGGFASRSLPHYASIRIVGGGTIVAVGVILVAAASVDAGAALFGCWSR